jgi:hypothetical protein
VVVGVVMMVAMMMMVVWLSDRDDDLRLRGWRVQGETQTQRTECEQTSLDVNVHDRLPELDPAFEPELVGKMPNRGEAGGFVFEGPFPADG